MDSAGVGELVAGLKTAQHLGAHLKILNASERVQLTLYIARLLPVFEIYEDEHGARCSSFAAAAERLLRRGYSSSGGDAATLIGSFEMTRSSIEHSGQLMVSPTSSS